jgi:pimeloyl-ACP methyl ester carboxylesterase
MHTRAWYGVLPLMTEEYDVVLYDFLGQGNSSQLDSADRGAGSFFSPPFRV